jgi:hypothetical protein
MQKMNRITITSAIIITFFTPYACLAYSGGSGTSDDPYQIANAADWQELMAASSDLDKSFLLTADIDLTGITVTQIAPDTSSACYYQGPAFTGVFDGNNHIVRNVTINLPSSDYVGLFSYVGPAGNIKNLALENLQISGNNYVGGFIGYNEGNIYSCHATGSVSGDAYIGSLAGYNTGNISDCNASGSVSGYYGLGGLVGYNNSGSVSGCYANCSVSATSQVVGGLIGWNDNSGSVTSSHATGDASGQGLVGGLVGLNSSCNITSCYASGNVRGVAEIGGLIGWNDGGNVNDSNASGDVNGTNGVGGLIGINTNSGSMSFCYATGDVNGDIVVGGLLGSNQSSGTVNSCYASGSVRANKMVGGLTGGNEPGCIVTSCYSTGSVTGDNFVGGFLAGNNQGKVIRCYSTGKTKGNANVGGFCGIVTTGGGYEDTGNFWDKQMSKMTTSKMASGKTTAMMKTKSTFTAAGWDFASVWTIIEGIDYPKLAWQPFSQPPPGKFGTFDGQKNVKLTLKDCDNNNVMFSLAGPGYGEVNNTDCSFSIIALYNTTDKSVLTISTKGKAYTKVGSIICNGPMKSITAKTAELSGSIKIGPSLNTKAAVTIVFDRTEGLDIDSNMPIKSISTSDWWGGSLVAPSVGSITTTTKKTPKRYGDLEPDVTVTGVINSVKVASEISGSWDCNSIKSITASNTDEFYLMLSKKPDTKIPALGKLTVKYWIDYSQIISAGNIGTVTAGAMEDSNCFAGVTEGITGLPAAEAASFSETATIKSVAIKGIKGEPNCVINSNIAAANILSASLAYPQSDNGGVPFGIAADYIRKLTIKGAAGTKSFKELGKLEDSKTFDDEQIRLY